MSERAIKHGNGVLVSTEQIDAAWEYANSLPAGSEVRISVFYALRQLGIHYCEECGGKGYTGPLAPNVISAECPTCAKFTGEGWVIGGEDE